MQKVDWKIDIMPKYVSQIQLDQPLHGWSIIAVRNKLHCTVWKKVTIRFILGREAYTSNTKVEESESLNENEY